MTEQTRRRIRIHHVALLIVSVLNGKTDDIHRRADHISAASGDDGILLGMHRYTEVICIAFTDTDDLTHTPSLGAVQATTRATIITGRNNLIIIYNDGAILSSQTCGLSGDSFSDG